MKNDKISCTMNECEQSMDLKKIMFANLMRTNRTTRLANAKKENQKNKRQKVL